MILGKNQQICGNYQASLFCFALFSEALMLSVRSTAVAITAAFLQRQDKTYIQILLPLVSVHPWQSCYRK